MSAMEVALAAWLTVAAAVWSRASGALGWAYSLVVVTRELESGAALLLHSYLTHQRSARRHSPSNGAMYGVSRIWSRVDGRSVRVLYEWLRGGLQVYWVGRFPIWSSPTTRGTEKPDHVYLFRYLRGSLKFEQLMLEAVEHYDSIDLEARHRATVMLHSGNQTSNQKADHPGFAALEHSTPPGSVLDHDGGYRVVGRSLTDLGQPQSSGLDALSLRPELLDLVAEFGRIANDRQWFEERTVPWRFGWLLHGPPGTGKTSLVRALGIEHNMSVHRLDLSGMDNMRLAECWCVVRNHAPCIALFEDLDRVYHGSDPAPGAKPPTFDALLQTLGGIEPADGVFVFVTTNNIHHIDPALMRGGRIDRAIEVLGLDHSGRLKLARRILDDEQEVARMMHEPYEAGESPADLQERLRRRAMEIRHGGRR